MERATDRKVGHTLYSVNILTGGKKRSLASSNRRILWLFFWGITYLSTPALSQGSDGALVDRANKFFELAKNYEAALPLYQQAVDNGVSDPMVYYRLGVCYSYAPQLNDQYKGLPYLEKANTHRSGTEVPAEIDYFLGKMYHQDIQVDKAIQHFEAYEKAIAGSDKDKLADVSKQLEMCRNAAAELKQSKGIVIHSFDNLNSGFTEYNPLITADESMLAYTAVREERGKIVERIYTAHKIGKGWSEPTALDVKTKFNVGTAGLSTDGREMLIFVGGEGNSGSIYTIKRENKGWSSPATLSERINSRYLETTASLTPNGKMLYFASNRPDGYGGMDIYRSVKQADGNWGKPENLGPNVNTAANEDAPFIHPDSRTLFFTSDGHSTIGGKDIFKSFRVAGEWKKPVNLGYPINTPTDDNYFTLTANGKMGYFSSERKGGKGGQDIYYFEMPESEANVPLTMIKGRILAGDDLQPVPTQIKVVDVEANQKVDYVYNPDKETGNYLIILPPGRNYDLIIESEGYLPYTVNVNIPNQTYFYELYQEIHLKPIRQFDVVVGQEVVVKNAFFDVNGKLQEERRQANEAKLVQEGDLDLYDMMESIIATDDTAAYNYLLDLMYTTNPVDEVDFEAMGDEKVEAAGLSYYYDETGEDDLIAKKVGDETVYSLPTFYVTEEAIKQKQQKMAEPTAYDKGLLEDTKKIYFAAGESELSATDKEQLSATMEILKKYKDLGIEISGYASPEGDEATNRMLSNERAIGVLNYFNQRGIVRRRIAARGYGATASAKSSPEESRRVEVKIIDLKQYQEHASK